MSKSEACGLNSQHTCNIYIYIYVYTLIRVYIHIYIYIQVFTSYILSLKHTMETPSLELWSLDPKFLVARDSSPVRGKMYPP